MSGFVRCATKVLLKEGKVVIFDSAWEDALKYTYYLVFAKQTKHLMYNLNITNWLDLPSVVQASSTLKN